MRKRTGILAAVMAAAVGALIFQAGVMAKGNGEKRIENGIFVGDIDVSGMTREEAGAAVHSYVDGLADVPLTLNAVGGNQVTVTAGDMGIRWENEDVVDEAAGLGKQGNIIRRYKELKDLERNNKKFELELSFDKAALEKVLTEQCSQFDV